MADGFVLTGIFIRHIVKSRLGSLMRFRFSVLCRETSPWCRIFIQYVYCL